MSYRQSTYDPLATAPGPVLKPYDKWQWLGVAMTLGGMVLVFLSLAALFGWVPRRFDLTPGGIVLMGVGSLFVGHRRGPGRPRSDAQRRRGTRIFLATLLVGGAIAAGILLIAIPLKGA